MKIKALIATCLLMFGAAANANLIVDLEGEVVDGAGFNSINVSNADASAVIDLSFDFTYDAGLGGSNASWGSELIVEVFHVNTGQAIQIGTASDSCAVFGLVCEFDLNWAQTGGIFAATGNVAFNGPIANGSGDWIITLADSFDDAGPDGQFVFQSGSNVTVNQVPVPPSLLLMGLGLLGLGYMRRRAA